MAATTGGQPPAEVGRLVIPSGPSYADALGLKKPNKKPLPLKPISNWYFPMRTLKWDPMFNPEEETITTIAWISFPSLPPTFLERMLYFHLQQQ
ncbi:hypothetical protein KY289_006102 [Solanum tuberosum]|nr:hypothetical protein KY289_006102 [Solanum tuberosum]